MVRQILKNEWQFLSRSKTFKGVCLGFFLVFVIAIILGTIQTTKQTEAYNTAQAHLRAQWENIDAMNPHGAAHYGTYVFKPSNLMSSLDEGVNSVTGNVLRVEGHVQNDIVHSEASQMQTISKFGKLKSSLLLQYITPLLLIFLAFNSVSSERMSGRLKLLVLQGAKTGHILWAKTLAVWVFGLALLAIVMLVYSLINIENFTTDIAVRSVFFFVSYALFYFVLTGLTVCFSARWQNATVALTSMLGIWILWTIFLPNIFMSSVEKLEPLPSRNEFKTAMKDDRSKGLDGHNPFDDKVEAIEKDILKKYGVDSLSQLPINFDGIRMQADEDYGNLVWDKHFGNLSKVLTKQKTSYQLAGIFNPFISLQNASMGWAASDNLHHQEFLKEVELYRRGFIKTLNDEHAYGGSKTGDWSWKADSKFFKSVPDFQHRPIAFASVFSNYLLDLTFLILWSLIVVVLLIIGTKKMQVI